MDKVRGGGGQKLSVFVHAQGIKTVHAGGVKQWQNSIHVVVECPLRQNIIKVGSKLWQLTCISNITFSLPSALQRERARFL